MTVTSLPSIVILTGAGISSDSGLKTFRDPGGLWENHKPEEVANIKAFRRDPGLVNRFYNFRRDQLASVQPNPAHHALANLEKAWRGEFLIVTQNVDDLHERANSTKLIHMHGELLKVRCIKTKRVIPWKDPITPEDKCPCCNRTGTLRPHIVWFGEIPMEMNRIEVALQSCDIFVAIGTSGNVYPAAGFVGQIPHGAISIEINKESSAVANQFKEHRVGLASELVPAWVDELLHDFGIN